MKKIRRLNLARETVAVLVSWGGRDPGAISTDDFCPLSSMNDSAVGFDCSVRCPQDLRDPPVHQFGPLGG